ncbi:MAG: helix-turn-helix domain-containing protein [Bacteriovoracaceae bacterium]
MEKTEEVFYLQTLKAEYNRRKETNPMYSVRAFALNLDVDASNLSKILNDKLLPTFETADKICRNLKLDSEIAKEFMNSIAEEKACVELYKLNPDYTNCH